MVMGRPIAIFFKYDITFITDGLLIRVYKPADLRNEPAIMMYFHGGGHVLSNIESLDTCCRILAEYITLL